MRKMVEHGKIEFVVVNDEFTGWTTVRARVRFSEAAVYWFIVELGPRGGIHHRKTLDADKY